jgi:hypothetical protein
LTFLPFTKQLTPEQRRLASLMNDKIDVSKVEKSSNRIVEFTKASKDDANDLRLNHDMNNGFKQNKVHSSSNLSNNLASPSSNQSFLDYLKNTYFIIKKRDRKRLYYSVGSYKGHGKFPCVLGCKNEDGHEYISWDSFLRHVRNRHKDVLRCESSCTKHKYWTINNLSKNK